MAAYDHRITDYQKDRILKLKREDLATKTVSRRLGIPVYTINNFLRNEKEKRNEKGLKRA